MVITLKPNKFVATLQDFIKNSRVMFNFEVRNEMLTIQILNDYTVVSRIPCNVIDNSGDADNVSIWLTKSILVLDKQADIKITFTETAVLIEQDTFSGIFAREFEDRRTLPDIEDIELTQMFSNRLKFLAHTAVACGTLAKELSIADPDPIFSNNLFYINYSQTWFVTSMKFPRISFPMSTFRDFTFKLDEEAKYHYFEETSTLYIQTIDYDFYIQSGNQSIDDTTITAVNKIMAGLQPVTNIRIMEYVGKLQTIAQAFPKQKFPLTIGDGKFSINANSNNQRITVGHVNNYALSIMITSAQLDVICKLFKEDESIEILRGVNCICLVSKEKNLLLAGMIS